MKARLLLLAGVIWLGCSDEKTFRPVYEVPAEFEPYVLAFMNEAAQRGFAYRIDNLILRYDASLTSSVCGRCNETTSANTVQKIISINPNTVCWTNDEELEALIFHELGHCFLGRQHLSDVLPNGDPKSIMTPNNNVLYPPCSYAVGNDPCNKLYKREYYVSELFDTSTPVPDWAK